MKALRMIFAAAAAVLMTFAAQAAKTAKTVVADSGKTLRFVYDDKSYGTQNVGWFSVAEAEALGPSGYPPWHVKDTTVTKVVFDGSFADYRPKHCIRWFFGFNNLSAIESITNLDTSAANSLAYMFASCWSLQSLDLTGFDTANV